MTKRIVLLLVWCLAYCTSNGQDLCVDASDEGVLGCGESITVNFTPGDTPDPEAFGCMVGMDGSWFSFTVDGNVTEFEISGGTYELFQGADCNSLTDVSDCGSPDLITPDPATTYFILVNDNATVTTASFNNDDCANASFEASLNCGDNFTVTGESTACSDDDATGCMTGLGGVWYEFATETGLTSFDISGTDFELFEGSCGSLTLLSDCGSPGTIMADPNETYYILVNGSADVVAAPSPENDICASAIDINSGSGTTTCCGVIESEDDCGGSLSGVWFSYTPSGEAASFSFSNVSLSGSIGFEVYSGSDCGSLTLEDSYCGGPMDVTIEAPACDGNDFFIHVTSSGACGDFSVSATDIPGCGAAEDCDDATDPMQPSSGSGQVCFTGCTEYSCGGGCGVSTGVWFMVETDDVASYMEVIINNANFDPVVSIFQGDNCGSLTSLVPCETPNVGEPVPSAVNAMQTYYIEVGSETGPGGPFDICVLTDIAQVQCSEGELTPTRPEYPDEDPEGPYCPGETVNFCYTVDFTVDPIGQGNNCQWIQGIIPTIGGGWDLSVTPIDDQGPMGGWFWLDEGNVDHNVDSPVLELINTPNGLGLAYGNGGLSAGDLLPGGWWYTSPGGGGGCTNDGDPDTMWGLPASCGSSSTVEFCFDLTVRELEDPADCGDDDFTDLKVHIFTMADGQTGCWSNNSCAGDVPVVFDALMDCTSIVEVDAEGTEICTGESVDILVATADGSSAEIHVEVVEEGNTSGAEDWLFVGSGTIPDVIENEGDDIEVVIYEAYALSPPSVCKGPIKTIEVIVYPEIYVEDEEPYYICYGVDNEITPEIFGGTGGPYEVNWSNGATGTSIILPPDPSTPPGEYEITMVVTDEQGCTGEEVIEYEIVEPIEPEIFSTADAACKDGVDDLVEMVLEFVDIGTGPYDFNWESTPVGLDFMGSSSDISVIIDDESSATRDYTVLATVIDYYGCEYTAEYSFVIDNGPDLIFEIDECFGVGYDLIGYNTDSEAVTFEIYYDEDGDWSEDYDDLANEELVKGPLLGNSITYFAEEFGNYILVGTSSNGCRDYVILEVPPLPLPQLTASPNDTICAGTTLTIHVSNAEEFVEFDWSTGATADSIVVTPLDTITYFVETELDNGCEVSDSIRIVVNPLPLVNLTGSTTFCPGSFTTLTAQGPATSSYIWIAPDGSEVNTQSVQADQEGIWTIEIISQAGCMNMGAVNVTMASSLDPQIIGGNFCSGDSVTLDGGAGFDSYIWTDEANNPLGNDPTLNVTSGGLYILEVTSGNCSGLDSFIVEEIQPLPPALLENSAEVCNEDTGGPPTVLDLTSFVDPAVTGTWTNQNGIPVMDPSAVDFSGQMPGTRVYRFETNNAQAPCDNRTSSFTITILDCSCPDTEINNAPDFCVRMDTFVLDLIQITEEEGTWSVDPPQIEILNDSLLIIDTSTPAGDYVLTYTLTDPAIPVDCTPFSSVMFSVYEKPEAEIIRNATVCNEDTGNGPDSIDLDDLFVSGAPGDWSTNEPGITIGPGNVVSFTGADLGNYNFFYLTNNATPPCQNSNYTSTIRVIDCSCPTLELAVLPDLCSSGGGYNLNDFLDNPESEPGNWTVTGPGSGFLIGSNVDSEDVLPGTYTVTFSFNQSQGGSCINSVSGDINVIDPPVAMVNQQVSACNGTNLATYPVVIDLTTVITGDPGTWEAPMEYNNGVITDPSNVDFTGVEPGIYSFVYTTNNAQAPCDNTQAVLNLEVVNCNCPIISFNPPSPLCNDNPETNLNNLLTPVTPAGTWAFVDGPEVAVLEGDSLFVTEGIAAGSYTFEFTLETLPPAGCLESGQVTLEVNEEPQLNVISSAEVCNVPSTQGPNCIDLNDFVSGASGDWSAPANYTGDFSDIGNVCFDNEPVGSTFTFTFLTNSAASPCTDKTISTEITVLDCNCPNLSLDDPPVLCRDAGTIDLASLEHQDIVPGGWSFTDGPEALNLSGTDLNVTGAIPGFYTFRYTPDEVPPVDCPQYSEIVLEVIAPPAAGSAEEYMVCEGEAEDIDLGGLLTGEDTGGSWQETSAIPSTGNAFNADGNFTTEGQVPGTYIFTYSFEDIEPCNDVNSEVIIIIEEIPEADAGPDRTLTCNENEVQLGGGSTSTGSNYIYSWTSQNGSPIDDPTRSTIFATQADLYTLKVEDMATGCVAFDEVLVDADTNLPSFSTEVDPSPCFGENAGAIIISSVQGGDGNYLYSIDGGQTWSDQTLFSGLSPGNYTVILQDGNGCESIESGIVITEPGPLSVDTGEDRDIDYGSELYTLEIASSIDPAQIASVSWTENGELICSGSFAECGSIQVDPDEIGVYCATIVDINGCVAEDCVTLRERIVRDVYLPNMFSPSSNDNNARFYVNTDQFVESVEDFRIYDRWGEMVFLAPQGHKPNDPAYGWDGTFEDRSVEQGVYVYVIKVVYDTGETEIFTGNITLIR